MSEQVDTLRLRDGRELSYGTTGPRDGRPVVYCHSLPGSHVQPHFTEALMHELGVRLLALDRPGFGRSDFKPGRTVTEWPDDVAEFADALGLETFSLLGVSAGAPYLLACCLRIPERVERCAIMSGITPGDPPSLIHSVAPAPVRWAVRHSRRVSYGIHTALVAGMRRRPDRALVAMSRNPSEIDAAILRRPEVGQFVLSLCLAAAERGVRGWVYDDWLLSRDWDFAPSDLDPRVQVDLWYGEKDPAIPVEHVRKLAEQLPNARLHLLPGEAHFSIIFNRTPEVFTTLLLP
ncbi:MAG: alpha/beta fold hydrolase [Gaiellaceae bacterium]